MDRPAKFGRPLALILITATLYLASKPLRAQGVPAGPIHPKPDTQQQKKAPLPVPPQQKPFVVRSRLVTLPVAIANAAGEPVLNLTQKDFEVFDDGKSQPITHFDLGGDPLSIVLVLETSSRIAPLLPELRKAGIIFTEMVMAGTGEAAVVGYDDQVDLLRPMTTDPDRVLDAIRHIREGTSGARLYDALSRAEDILEAQPEERRRVILVMGEKNDSGSETKLGAFLRRAQLANTSIYTIGLSTTAAAFRKPPEPPPPVEAGPPGTYPLPPPPGTAQTSDTVNQQMGNAGIPLLPLIIWMVQHGVNAIGKNSLELAAEGTGGIYLRTFKDRSIETAMNTIGNSLHAEYLLGYPPPGEQPYGYHEIEVRVLAPHLKIRTRPGYYLAPPSNSSP
ncbi:MAG TPA: VWA domain-containing protein [Candidatus Acidoferrales bacterium]|nr:VWA domain-containing protein [Candidatus Acidoferrales bacterium]